MPDLLTPISDVFQTHMEASRRMYDALFSGTGKIDRVVIDVTRNAVDEHLRFAQAVGNSRDPQMLANLQSTFWANKPKEFQAVQKELLRIMAEVQNDLGRATQSYFEQLGARTMRSTPFGFPPGADKGGMAAMNPFAGMMSVWENTMKGMSSLADQAISTARSGATRASDAAVRTAQAAARAGDEVMEAAGSTIDYALQQERDIVEDVRKEGDTGKAPKEGTPRHKDEGGPDHDDRKPGIHRRK